MSCLSIAVICCNRYQAVSTFPIARPQAFPHPPAGFSQPLPQAFSQPFPRAFPTSVTPFYAHFSTAYNETTYTHVSISAPHPFAYKSKHLHYSCYLGLVFYPTEKLSEF